MMTKIFRFEDLTCHDEIFKRFISLAKKKRGDVTKFLKDLVSFELNVTNPIQ
jgi:hypothetical protein